MRTKTVLFWLGLLSAIISALLGHSKYFGPEESATLELAAAIIGAVMLYLKQSPLGEDLS